MRDCQALDTWRPISQSDTGISPNTSKQRDDGYRQQRHAEELPDEDQDGHLQCHDDQHHRLGAVAVEQSAGRQLRKGGESEGKRDEGAGGQEIAIGDVQLLIEQFRHGDGDAVEDQAAEQRGDADEQENAQQHIAGNLERRLALRLGFGNVHIAPHEAHGQEAEQRC